MRKNLIFATVMISLLPQFLQAQSGGKVGVNTSSPTESLHVNGTARVSSLPLSGSGNIYNGAATQSTVFTGKNTVVADANGNLGVVQGIPAPSGANENSVWYDGKNAASFINLGTVQYPYNSNIFIYTSATNANSSSVTAILPAADASNAGQWFRVCNVGNSGGGASSPKVSLSGLLDIQYGKVAFGGAATTSITNTAGSRCSKAVSSKAPDGKYYWVTVSNS